MIVNFLKQFPYTRKCGKGKTLTVFTLSKRLDGLKIILREKVRIRCNSSVFSSIWTEYGEVLRIYPYSVRMPENTYQTNSEYGHFSRSFIHKHSFSIFSTISSELLQLLRFSLPKHKFKKLSKKIFFPVPVNKRCGARRD